MFGLAPANPSLWFSAAGEVLARKLAAAIPAAAAPPCDYLSASDPAHRLATALAAHDPATHVHSQRVAHFSRLIAQALDLESVVVESIALAGLLHDVGKIGIPHTILHKRGLLTAHEWSVMRSHAEQGAAILAHRPRLIPLIPMVRSHHERWDGHGYPDRLAGPAIPLGTAIIAVADAFDTLTSTRPYKPAQAHAAACAEIRDCAGTQFHPEVVAAFEYALADSAEG
jgi:HD-GYP domain-containing protein (c-di-GMP phosphodiesterase class II)